jgi:hypothetical protein
MTTAAAATFDQQANQCSMLEPRGMFSSFKLPTITFSAVPGSQCQGYFATL